MPSAIDPHYSRGLKRWLRHTEATLLLARGIPVKVVSEMLGHANIGVTLSLYAHLLPHMQQQAASTTEEVLRGSIAGNANYSREF
jgi:site-specific recombinase XerD